MKVLPSQRRRLNREQLEMDYLIEQLNEYGFYKTDGLSKKELTHELFVRQAMRRNELNNWRTNP